MIWFGLAEFFVTAFDCNPAPSLKLGSESVTASSFCQEFCSCNIAKTRIDPARFVLSYDISRSTKFCTYGIAQQLWISLSFLNTKDDFTFLFILSNRISFFVTFFLFSF